MLVSVFKLGVCARQKNKEGALKQSGTQQRAEIPNISQWNSKKWPFTDASKESFEFEFFKKMQLFGEDEVKQCRGEHEGPAGKHRWLKPSSTQTQPMKPLL